MQYLLAIHKDPDSCYGVTVPGLPGCHAAGDTLEDAINQAKDAIESHIETLILAGDDVPVSPAAEDIRSDPDYADVHYWALCDVDMAQFDSKTERINVTIPRFVLSRIDRQLGEGQRSGFLTEAALKALNEA